MAATTAGRLHDDPTGDDGVPVSFTAGAKLCISYHEASGTSHATTVEASYPIKFIVPRTDGYDKPYEVIYLLGFGGGIVAGDVISISATVKKFAVAVIKTQGSTKVFKSEADKECCQKISARLFEDAFLLFVPDPTTCFKDARFRQSQQYRLAPSSSLIMVDWYTSGRASRGEIWCFERLFSALELFVGDEQVMVDNMDLYNSPGIATISQKVGNCGAFGTVLLVGPRTKSLRLRASSIMHRQTYQQKRQSMMSATSSSASAAAASYTGRDPGLGPLSVSSSSASRFSEKGDDGGSTSSPNTAATATASFRIPQGDPLVSVSDLGSAVSVVRFAAHSTEDAHRFLHELLRPICAGSLQSLPVPYADRIHGLGAVEKVFGVNDSTSATIAAMLRFDAENKNSSR